METGIDQKDATGPVTDANQQTEPSKTTPEGAATRVYHNHKPAGDTPKDTLLFAEELPELEALTVYQAGTVRNVLGLDPCLTQRFVLGSLLDAGKALSISGRCLYIIDEILPDDVSAVYTRTRSREALGWNSNLNNEERLEVLMQLTFGRRELAILDMCIQFQDRPEELAATKTLICDTLPVDQARIYGNLLDAINNMLKAEGPAEAERLLLMELAKLESSLYSSSDIPVDTAAVAHSSPRQADGHGEERHNMLLEAGSKLLEIADLLGIDVSYDQPMPDGVVAQYTRKSNRAHISTAMLLPGYYEGATRDYAWELIGLARGIAHHLLVEGQDIPSAIAVWSTGGECEPSRFDCQQFTITENIEICGACERRHECDSSGVCVHRHKIVGGRVLEDATQRTGCPDGRR